MLALACPAGGRAVFPDSPAELPARVRRIVLHTLGGPFYRDPTLRFVFFPPEETIRRWGRASFGAHWIIGADGTLWPRHPARGEPASIRPPVDAPADAAWRARLAREAAPVYSHVHNANSGTVGIELAHSGASQDPFAPQQVRTLAWLLLTLLDMSGGRLDVTAIRGHKDLDRRPAWASLDCQRPGCPYFAGLDGRPLRWRVDPPEAVFAALAEAGLHVPRDGGEGDRHLLRAEALPPGTIPEVRR